MAENKRFSDHHFPLSSSLVAAIQNFFRGSSLKMKQLELGSQLEE